MNNEAIQEDVETMKKTLVELAKKAWNDKSVNNKVSFYPSEKLNAKIQELFGHSINEVFITSNGIRHIKKHHSEYEEKRGQVSLTPNDIADIYDVVNNFDNMTLEESDKQGNKKALAVLNRNGKSYALLIERGKNKAEVKTFYKRKTKKATPMSDVTSPEPNVRNDSATPSSNVTSSVTQNGETGKRENSPLNQSQTPPSSLLLSRSFLPFRLCPVGIQEK